MQKGFTLIELVVVAGIIILVSAGGIAGFRSYEGRQKIIQEGRNIKSMLRQVQTSAQAGIQPKPLAIGGCQKKGDNYGLYSKRVTFFPPTRFTIQSVCDDDPSSSVLDDSTSYDLSSGMQYSVTPGGVLFVDFRALSQGIFPEVTLCIYKPSATPVYYKLTLKQSGEIEDVGESSSC